MTADERAGAAIAKRTARTIQQDIDHHLNRCGLCFRWFWTDDDLLDVPCAVMRDLHDEYDAKVRGASENGSDREARP